jgi:hypothetical protein
MSYPLKAASVGGLFHFANVACWPDSDMAQRPARVRYRHQTGSFACAVRSATNSCGFGLHVRGVDVLGRLARRGDLLAVPEHMKQFVNEL